MRRTTTYLSLRNYAGWYGDSCGRLIASVSHGWREWLDSEDNRGATALNGLRLVHRRSCRYNARKVFRNRRSLVEGLCRERFTGSDGLICCYHCSRRAKLPALELIALAKRVQISGCELASHVIGEENVPQLVYLLWSMGSNRK